MPAWAGWSHVAGPPPSRDSARELSDLINVAFQVRKHKGALGFRHTLLARQARGAERQHTRLDRLRRRSR